MYEDNNWYGHRSILLKYLKKKDRAVFAQIQHGWYRKPSSSPWKYKNNKLINKLAPTLSWSRKYQNSKNLNIIRIGAPFLYLEKFLSKKKKIKVLKGTAFFPSHGKHKKELKAYKFKDDSNRNFSYEYDYEYYVKAIKKKYKPPYEVCLHISDFENKKIINFFKKKNWKIYCFGKKEDPLSLIKLNNFLKKKKNLIFSGLNTSAIIYSMYLKKKIEIILPKKFTSQAIKDFFIPDYYIKIIKNYKNINFSYNFAKKELGYKFLKEKKELEKILSINNFFKNLIALIVSVYRKKKYN